MMRYQDIRLSKHFVMLDFMYSREVYLACEPRPAEANITDEVIRNGRHLCETLLEPCEETWGPSSVSAGYIPEDLANRTGLTDWRPQPHKWNDRWGACADLCWHDAAHRGLAPIDICHCIDHDSPLPYERLITYGGSEFVCIGTKGYSTEGMRHALYENERRPGEKPKFNSIGIGEDRRHRRRRGPLPDYLPAEAWQRKEGELVNNYRENRPNHYRVSRYFTLLDFCRSEIAVARGLNGVPMVPLHNMGQHALKVCRMMGETLDPFVNAVGRVSVTKGLLPLCLGRGAANKPFIWWNEQPAYGLRFLVPQGTDMAAIGLIEEQPHVEHVQVFEHPSETHEVRILIKPIEPRFTGTVGGRFFCEDA